ncbi:hypothetical protein F4825DRAFT_424609 [Nemania diffusa]|nr:hypothetical protein F4825DRAFT_424609 [Nemania diffusa]
MQEKSSTCCLLNSTSTKPFRGPRCARVGVIPVADVLMCGSFLKLIFYNAIQESSLLAQGHLNNVIMYASILWWLFSLSWSTVTSVFLIFNLSV